MINFKVYDAQEGISCRIMDAIRESNPKIRFWVSKHVFVFGNFYCATVGREEAETIAETLNKQSVRSNLSEFIVDWLKNRNGGELEDAFDTMMVQDYRQLQDELQMILEAGGKPKNWV